MSQVYPKLKEQLFTWVFTNTTPADVVLKVCGIDNTYVYDANHDVFEDLGASLIINPVTLPYLTLVNGVVVGDVIGFTGIVPGPVLDALVVYMSWTGGTQLCCWIDDSSDASLPLTLVSTVLSIQWDAQGVFKI